jgi:hypothetical protein
MNMLFFVVTFSVLGSAGFAQMTPEEALANLAIQQAARASAATQPSGLTNAEADELRRQIIRLETENAQLKKQLATITTAASALSAPTSQPDPLDKPNYTEGQWALANAMAAYRATIDSDLHRLVAATDAARATAGPTWLKSQDDLINKLRDRSRKLYAWQPVSPDLDFYSLKVGSIGRLTNLRREVVQVTEATDLIAAVGTNAFWLHGVDTSKMTDGASFTLNGVFYVPSTKKYDTAGGATRTLLLLETVDDANMKPAMDYLRAQAQAARGGPRKP